MSIPDKPLRIAILEADHPLKNTAERWGTYGGVFTNLLQNAATSLGWNVISTLNVTKWDIERHQNFPPSLDSIDGILITGSRASAFDDTPWIVALVEYVRTALSIPKSKRRVKIIGVCFGHQIVARALGCTVDRSENGWEASVTKFLLSDAGCEIFGKDVLSIHEMHRDIVRTIPQGAINLGSSDKCPLQGFYCPQRYITIQGHPEFSQDIATEILQTRKSLGIFTDEEFADMMSRVGNPHDGVLVAQVFLRFLVE